MDIFIFKPSGYNILQQIETNIIIIGLSIQKGWNKQTERRDILL